MDRPVISLFVAIGLALLGGCLMVPVTAHKALLGPDGQTVYSADGRPVMVRDHYREFRVNWPSYVCFLGAAISMMWTLFLVVFGVVTLIRQAPIGGPAEPPGDSSASGGPPSVS
jgi:hypothetical protein